MSELINNQNQKCRSVYQMNLDWYDENRVTDYWDIPTISSCDKIPKKIVRFSSIKKVEREEYCVHFFMEDYEFERVWSCPFTHIDGLKRCDCVVQPDFSLHRDMPLPMQIWNLYRSRALTQLWQDEGIPVIPLIKFGDERTFDICFDGLPKDSVYAISTQSKNMDDETMDLFDKGVKKFLSMYTPKHLVVYGDNMEYDWQGIPTTVFCSDQQEIFRRLRNGRRYKKQQEKSKKQEERVRLQKLVEKAKRENDKSFGVGWDSKV